MARTAIGSVGEIRAPKSKQYMRSSGILMMIVMPYRTKPIKKVEKRVANNASTVISHFWSLR